jgi:hypothetical protein
MSNIPTPKEIPPTPQQVDATLRSVITASQTLINTDPRHYTNLRATFMQFYSHPTFQLILGLPTQNTPTQPPPDNQLKAELSEIKSTISALSKAVNSLPPKAKGATPASQSPPPKGKPSTQGQGSGNVTPPTFASKAAAQSRPSLILDLRFPITKRQSTTDIVTFVNDRLYTQGHQQVKLSAAKWTSKGNLVFTAHHTVTQAQLTDASHTILTLLREEYPNTFSLTTELTARANVKWSKILINSVPTGINNTHGPWTSEECHRALIAHNPSYAALKVTQKPSWVREPTTYKIGDHSSLVVAFEDPDGSQHRSILSSHQLYLLGVRAKVSCWKEMPRPPPTDTTPTATTPPTDPVTESRSSTPAATRAPVGPPSSVPASSVRKSQQQPNTPRPQRTARSRKTKD